MRKTMIHIPHSSLHIPDRYFSDFVMNKEDLIRLELNKINEDINYDQKSKLNIEKTQILKLGHNNIEEPKHFKDKIKEKVTILGNVFKTNNGGKRWHKWE